jgi:hypothetical protein
MENQMAATFAEISHMIETGTFVELPNQTIGTITATWNTVHGRYVNFEELRSGESHAISAALIRPLHDADTCDCHGGEGGPTPSMELD